MFACFNGDTNGFIAHTLEEAWEMCRDDTGCEFVDVTFHECSSALDVELKIIRKTSETQVIKQKLPK